MEEGTHPTLSLEYKAADDANVCVPATETLGSSRTIARTGDLDHMSLILSLSTPKAAGYTQGRSTGNTHNVGARCRCYCSITYADRCTCAGGEAHCATDWQPGLCNQSRPAQEPPQRRQSDQGVA